MATSRDWVSVPPAGRRGGGCPSLWRLCAARSRPQPRSRPHLAPRQSYYRAMAEELQAASQELLRRRSRGSGDADDDDAAGDGGGGPAWEGLGEEGGEDGSAADDADDDEPPPEWA
jgi:hypothetical protein